MLRTERHRKASNDKIIEMRELCASQCKCQLFETSKGSDCIAWLLFLFPCQCACCQVATQKPNTAYSQTIHRTISTYLLSYNYEVSYWAFSTGKNRAACTPEFDPTMPAPGLQGYTIAEKLVCPNSCPSQREREILAIQPLPRSHSQVLFPTVLGGRRQSTGMYPKAWEA